jgi:tetratricopeptide (TPR) repeat protein
MKIRIRPYSLFATALILLLTSCELADKDDAQKILHTAPYAVYTDSINQFPQNNSLYTKRAFLLSQNNKHELATADYKKAWELKPGSTTALQYISNLLLTDKTGEAIKLLKESIAAWPDDLELRRRLSEIYMQIGQDDKALEEIDGLLMKDSLNFETWFERGELLGKIKDTVGAIYSLERSYALQPINYTGIPLANLYANKKDPRALSVCDSLISRDTTGILNDVYYIKGVYYSDTRQYDKALEQFNECIRRDWKFVDAYIEKGIIYFEEKKYTEALDIFVMAATVSNTNADAYYWMARCYEATGKKDQAITNYQRALALDKTFTDARDAIRRLKS